MSSEPLRDAETPPADVDKRPEHGATYTVNGVDYFYDLPLKKHTRHKRLIASVAEQLAQLGTPRMGPSTPSGRRLLRFAKMLRDITEEMDDIVLEPKQIERALDRSGISKTTPQHYQREFWQWLLQTAEDAPE